MDKKIATVAQACMHLKTSIEEALVDTSLKEIILAKTLNGHHVVLIPKAVICNGHLSNVPTDLPSHIKTRMCSPRHGVSLRKGRKCCSIDREF